MQISTFIKLACPEDTSNFQLFDIEINKLKVRATEVWCSGKISQGGDNHILNTSDSSPNKETIVKGGYRYTYLPAIVLKFLNHTGEILQKK